MSGSSVFVVLEGLHGVGKSEVARQLADAICADHMPTVAPIFKDVRGLVDRGTSLEWRHAVYAVAVLDAGWRIRERLQAGRSVVVESWLYRTMAFHRGMGSDLKLPVDTVELPEPDWQFLLTCNDSERRRRLDQRGSSNSAYWLSRAESNSTKIEEQYRSFGLQEVDTTGLEIDSVVGRLRDRIGR